MTNRDLPVGRTVRQDMAREKIDSIGSAGDVIRMQQHLEVPDRTSSCVTAFAPFCS